MKIIKNLFTTLFLTIIYFSVSGQTNVSGGIYSNTTWSLANSPYVVVDTTVVFPGVTLTIEPGVIVKFVPDVYLEIRLANLVAIGTAKDSIIFTSNSSNPSPGDWFKVYSNGGTCNFNYCVFSYGSDAFSGQEYNFSGSAIVRNSNFRYNVTALNVTGSDLVCQIDSSVFIHNTNQAIDCETQFGIINHCIVSYNQNGAYIAGVLLKNSIIDRNIVEGINALNGSKVENNKIRYNGVGIQEGILGGFNAIGNTIDNNTTGLNVLSTFDTITCNHICNNTVFDLYYNAVLGNNTFAPDNYWCTLDSASTETVIHDGYDNINLGLIHFMPIDTTQCYLMTEIQNNFTQDFSLQVFPNPVKNELIISLPAINSVKEVKIFNQLGALTYSSKTYSSKIDLNVSYYSKGLYII